jgi:threonine dehydrogenase-like Zn-dependent dehydrogenase
MKTLLYPEYERLEVTDQPAPEPARGEVRLRVAACGICGSELEAFRNRSPRRVPPLILGHEFCGVVESVAPDVEVWAPGQRVVSHSLVACGTCVRCARGDTHLCAQRQIFGMHRPGAFAEMVCAPAKSLVAWPGTLAPEAASTAEPLANGIHVVGLARRIAPSLVVVVGAGPLGLLAQQAFRKLTAADVVMVDRVPERLETAKRLGAKEVIHSGEEDVVARITGMTGGEGADVVVDAAGAAWTKANSVRATRAGGMTVWLGLHENTIPFDSFDVTLGERTIQGSYCASIEELELAVDMLARGRVDGSSWVKTFSLDDGVKAFERMLKPAGDDIKAVILPTTR